MTGDGETLEEFKNSFAYGHRNDLSFKFLKSLTPDEAGEFFRALLEEIGASFDHGDLGRIHEVVCEWQVRGYAPSPEARPSWSCDDAPFTPLAKPLGESRLGLLTSSGHFVAGDDPNPFGVEGMTQDEAVDRIGEFMRAAPELSVIAADVDADRLRVRHGGYDIRSVVADHNVAFPRDALAEARDAGRIGALTDAFYSFVGATSQGRLRRSAVPGWIERFRDAGTDVLLLVPV